MSFDRIVLDLVVATEGAGVIVIAITSLLALLKYLRGLPSPRFEAVRLDLAKGLALGLEFKVGSEILRTVIVRTFAEIGFLAAIIAVRSILNFLIDREMSQLKNEVKDSGKV